MFLGWVPSKEHMDTYGHVPSGYDLAIYLFNMGGFPQLFLDCQKVRIEPTCRPKETKQMPSTQELCTRVSQAGKPRQ